MHDYLQSAKEDRSETQEKIERLDVLAGLRKYAQESVLLVGRPGSGKSTALVRLLLEEAERGRGAGVQGCRGGNSSSNVVDNGVDGLGKIPILVELRYYQTSVLDLIRNFLKRHCLLLETATIEQLLFNGQFLLLVDGINELPSEAARRDLYKFRQDYQKTTPMIFTTRDLGVGGDLGITKKLEMQPLTAEQMQQFVRAYLPKQGEQMLQKLGDRLREFGETPLLLLMLCSLFQATGDIPDNLGLVFRQFTQSYERQFRHGIPVTDESRRWWFALLKHLAFHMTKGDKLTELNVAIPRLKAEDVLTQFLQAEKFDRPRDRALQWLQDLLNHHLIQLGANDQIEFRHQLIQEYYTAECLLQQLPNLTNDCLQREYLNYLKWTEPLKLMLGLVDDEAQAVRVVKLALDVDWQLGAKLAGAVKPDLQQQTVNVVEGLEVPLLLKIRLLGLTKSDKAVPSLIKLLEDKDSDVRSIAASALKEIKSEAALPQLMNLLKNEKFVSANNGGKLLDAIQALEAIQENCKYYKCETKPETNLPSFTSIQSSLMYILHLSDLHFGTPDQAKLWSNQLASDLQNELEIPHLDALILSGDIANKSTPDEYKAAQEFLNKLSKRFSLQPDKIIIVPGNHDLNWKLAKKAYSFMYPDEYEGELKEGEYIVKDDLIGVRDEEKYTQRFEYFSNFYQEIKKQPYSLDYDQQYTLEHFPNHNLLILGLNSAWQLDHDYKSRASINMNALSNALEKILDTPKYKNCLKIAVWHHPVNSSESMQNVDFLQQLAVNNFQVAIHGHIHEAKDENFQYDTQRGIRIIAAGTFGAPAKEQVTGIPLQYNLLTLDPQRKVMTIETRKKEKIDGAWSADARWGDKKNPVPRYDIQL